MAGSTINISDFVIQQPIMEISSLKPPFINIDYINPYLITNNDIVNFKPIIEIVKEIPEPREFPPMLIYGIT